MPSTATITAFYEFVAGTTIRSAQVNSNFSAFRGHLCPVDPTLTSALATSGAYDIGSSDHFWRQGYFQALLFSQQASSYTAPAAGFNSIYFKTDGKAYSRNSAGTENALGGGALVCTGTAAAGITLTAAGGILFNTAGGSRQMWFVRGDTTAGTDITANPQISPGADLGQELILVGTVDTHVPLFEDGNGLKINGPWSGYANCVLSLFWNGSVWQQLSRTDY